MFYSKIKKILEKSISDNEELKPLERYFHDIEYEIDKMANAKKPNADMNAILRRAKELIYRAFDGYHSWLNSKWKDIEDDIEEELKDLEK